MSDTADIVALAGRWVAQRDAYATRYRSGSGLFSSDATHLGFNRLVNGFVDEMRPLLPVRNLAEMEGVAELMNALLNQMRSAHVGG